MLLWSVLSVQAQCCRSGDGEVYNDAWFHPDNKRWVYIQPVDSSAYEWLYQTKSVVPSSLRLTGSKSTLTQNDSPTFIGLRQQHNQLVCSASIMPEGDTSFEAGLAVYQCYNRHCDFYVRQDADGRVTIGVRCELPNCPHDSQSVVVLPSSVRLPLTLRVRSDAHSYRFDYALDGKEFVTVSTLPVVLLRGAVSCGACEVLWGMYATGNGSASFSQWQYRVY